LSDAEKKGKFLIDCVLHGVAGLWHNAKVGGQKISKSYAQISRNWKSWWQDFQNLQTCESLYDTLLLTIVYRNVTMSAVC